MNRRSILALIGFAPLATAAAAFPRVADPVKLASTGGREVSADLPFVFNDGTLYLDEVRYGVVTVSETYVPGIVEDVNRQVSEHLEWVQGQLIKLDSTPITFTVVEGR